MIESDDISDYLEIENEEYLEERNYKDFEIFYLEYPKEMNIEFSKEKFKFNIKNIFHNLSINNGSSGAPIILKYDNKVIWIHRGGTLNKNTNINLKNNEKDIENKPFRNIFWYNIKKNEKIKAKKRKRKRKKIAK